jgi:hypothetical protein
MTVAELRQLLNYYPGTYELKIQDGIHLMRVSEIARVELAPNTGFDTPSHLVFVTKPPVTR